MANPSDPALYLYLQSAVGTSDTAGYTRLLGETADLQHYLDFSSSAIEAGTPVPAPNTRASLPVDANIRLYFSDSTYGPPPPPPKFPNGPVHVPVRKPLGLDLLHPPLIYTYEASDGTPLATGKDANGQVTSFSGTGKDGHAYALTTAVVTENAAGREVVNGQAVNVLWLKASLSVTVDGAAAAQALVFAVRFAPTANLFQVSVEKDNVLTTIDVDYANATANNGTGQLTRRLLYYGNSFMAQGLQVSANQQGPGMYLAAACSFWPMIGWVDFFGPALQRVVGNPPALAASPLVTVGSVNLATQTPGQYLLANYLSDAQQKVVPGLGPLAASFVDTTLPGASLAWAAQWLGLLMTSTAAGRQALTAELTAAYDEWVAYISSSSGQRKTHLNPFEPNIPPDDDE
jgi:hypothetical protein